MPSARSARKGAEPPAPRQRINLRLAHDFGALAQRWRRYSHVANEKDEGGRHLALAHEFEAIAREYRGK